MNTINSVFKLGLFTVSIWVMGIGIVNQVMAPLLVGTLAAIVFLYWIYKTYTNFRDGIVQAVGIVLTIVLLPITLPLGLYFMYKEHKRRKEAQLWARRLASIQMIAEIEALRQKVHKEHEDQNK